jgi:hypothetical protein
MGSLKSTNTEELESRKRAIADELTSVSGSSNIEDILKASKLDEELNTIQAILDERNPVESYYLKNADIMLKYYGTSEKIAHVGSAMDQNTFLRYLNQTATGETGISKKELFEQYACRMKLHTAQPTNTWEDMTL